MESKGDTITAQRPLTKLHSDWQSYGGQLRVEPGPVTPAARMLIKMTGLEVFFFKSVKNSQKKLNQVRVSRRKRDRHNRTYTVAGQIEWNNQGKFKKIGALRVLAAAMNWSS
jgi:hypothetical protein